MTSCSLCHRLPASIGTECPDCFWLSAIKPRLELRQRLLDAQGENETALKVALERVAPVGRQADGSYRSILHRCVCGHAADSWLSLHLHMKEEGTGHSYILHGNPIKPAALRRPKAAEDAWVDPEEIEI